MKKFQKILLLLIILQAFWLTPVARADTGPKPTMDFEFIESGELMIVSGILYECDQSDCSDAQPLEELGPQGLRCDATSCRALGYGFAPYHILEIEFSDSHVSESSSQQKTRNLFVRPSTFATDEHEWQPMLGHECVND